jgi:hypothetical protein
MYRDTNGTGEWEAYPYDFDNTMGNWVYEENLRTFEPIYGGKGNNLFRALFDDPVFEQMYLRRLRTLMDQLYGPPDSSGTFEARIHELSELLAPDAQLDNAAWPPWGTNGGWEQQVRVLRDNFIAPRREFLYGQTTSHGGPIPAAQPTDASLTFGRIDVSPVSGRQDEEFIELLNPNDYAVDLSGWSLDGDVTMSFRLGTVIPAGGTLFLSPNVNAFRARSEGPTGGQGLMVQGAYAGRLGSGGGVVRVLDPTGRVAALAEFSGEPTPVENALRITELMYHPGESTISGFNDRNDFEFVELRNTGNETLDLTNVLIRDGIQFDFAQSSFQTLEPNQSVLVVRDRVAFEARYGYGLPIAGQYNGRLSNGGERIVLEEGGTVILDFEYQDVWYPSTDGGGSSLVIVNPMAARGAME